MEDGGLGKRQTGFEQSSFEYDKRKVVLSEEVFVRLQGLINVTAFNKGMVSSKEIKNGGYEYGGVLYGKLDEDGNINFLVANEESDYEVNDGKFLFQSGEKMMNEFLEKIQNPEFDCFAHVHTHPYTVEANRFLSKGDVDYYKTTFCSSNDSFEKLKKKYKKQINTFGCLLAQSSSNLPQYDDISFVYFNKQEEKMYYLPNIFVKSKSTGVLYPLKKVKEKLYMRKEDGRLFNENQYYKENGSFEVKETERVLLDTEEFEK